MGKTFLSILRTVAAGSSTWSTGGCASFAAKSTGSFAKFIDMGCSTSKTELGMPQIDINFNK